MKLTSAETGAQTILDETGRRVLAWAFPASPESVARVLAAREGGDDGRSAFQWLRLANGDLMLGTFPRGATYEDCELDAQLPADALSFEDVRGEQSFEVRNGVSYLRDGKGVSVAFYRMPENDQLLVSINTEDSQYDNDAKGEPILQVLLNDATLYDHERPKPAVSSLFMAPEGPYLLRCEFNPQAWVNDNAIDADPEGPTVWEGDYNWIPARQRGDEADELRFHPNAPEWVRDWRGPFSVSFQVRFTVVGYFPNVNPDEGNRYTEAFWADNAAHAEEQAIDSARAEGELVVTAVLYGEAQVAA